MFDIFEIIVAMFLFMALLFADTTAGVLKWGIMLLVVIKLSRE